MVRPLVFFLLFLSTSLLHAQNWIWARSSTFGGGEGFEVAADDSANVYVTGYYPTGSLSFGAATMTNSGFGTAEIFLAKFDANGNPLWGRSPHGADWDQADGIAVDDSGNVYVTGWFQSDTLRFGADTLFNSGGGWGDSFVAKYSAGGTERWARQIAGTGHDRSASIAFNSATGQLTVVGTFSSTVLTAGLFTLTSSGTGEAFIITYDAQGNVVWAQSSSGNGVAGVSAYGVNTDLTGNVFVTGSMSGASASFGSVTLTAPGNNYLDMFVVKYDMNGNAIWGRNAGTPHGALGYDVAADPAGNSFVVGYYDSTITFGSITLNTAATTSSDEAFVVKYDQSGNVLWALSSSSPSNTNVTAFAVSTDASGNAYVTGGRMNTPYVVFAGDSFNVAGPDPMFLLQYDPAGNLQCYTELPSGGDDQNSVVVRKGNVFIGGDYMGNMILGEDTLNGNSGENIFVARFSCNISGVEEPNVADPSISIYPNPSGGMFTIEPEHSSAGEEVQITDVTGRMIYRSKLIAPSMQIDLSAEADGIYFCRIGTSCSKVILQR